MGLIKKQLENLKDSDIISFVLFALFQLKNDEDYAALSELAFILDKKNLINLCEYFGGLTLKIPTITELEILVSALLLYKYIDLDNLDLDTAIKKFSNDELNTRELRSCYSKISDLLKNYEFTSRGKS